MFTEKLNIFQNKVKFFYNCLKRDYVKEAIDLEAEYCLSDEPVTFEEKNACRFKSVKPGDIWGRGWQCAWFHLTGEIPAKWDKKSVCIRINIDGEGLLFSNDGIPLRSITDHSVFQVNFVNEFFQLYNVANGGEKIDLWIDAGANSYFGMMLNQHPRLDTSEKDGIREAMVKSLQLCLTDEPLRQLGLDWEIAMSLLNIYPQSHYRYRQITTVLIEAIDLFKGDSANAPAVRELLKEKLFSAKTCDSALTVTAVGHAHIDTAWLWPMRETIRKSARTFANQIANIEKFPGYVFGASQPQHYQFVKDRYPALYDKVKTAVANGRWELQGGMWVEADCNLISGESMIRQFLHGKNFYMDEFGIEVKNLWLPDVFGYSGIMPQIIKGCGCDFFLTQKISWNQFNKFPHNTFIWRGIDGSEVITHFPPENNYNAIAMPEAVANAQNNFKEADQLPEFLSLFGIGDGGGGPTEDHIERTIRMKNLEGCPKVTMGKAEDFFERLRKYADKLEIWEGELYLEKHQGTLTTQAWIKKSNRKLEYLLKNVELLWSCLSLDEYPAIELDKLWKTLLVHQFHDIIPGSSITRVYREAKQKHSEIFEACQKLLDCAAEKLFVRKDDCITLFNVLSTAYAGKFTLPAGWESASVDGRIMPGQKNGSQVEVFLDIAPGSFIALEKTCGKMPQCIRNSELILENDLIVYEFNKDAQIVRIFDREAGREVLDCGAKANVLSLYFDDPANYDAWDIDIGYENQLLETAHGVNFEKISGENGQTLVFELAVGNSIVKQEISIGKEKKLEFKTAVIWNENHKMLRTSFPVNVHASDAAFDLQYGFIKRPTVCNTSWDMARYEVVGHRYADISDSQYGVALLNDCKYGYKVRNNVLDLNLLRSPKYPDFSADLGEHEFTYAFLPHTGTLQQSNVISHAAMLNQQPLCFSGFSPGKAALPCRMDSEDISLEVIKKAEKENCLVIRLAENKGKYSSAVLDFNIPVNKLVETNMIEWEEKYVCEVKNNNFNVELKPFEIKTYKVY